RVEFDDELVSAIELDELPKDWRKSPVPPSVQLLGDDWVRKGKSAVLRVPSVIIPSEYNYVLNVAHPQFGKIKIREAESFGFDPRLLKQPKSLD
ncbi:MAG TPA: RES family NAD+ phosphorylase, partial [Terriglobales bacterium]|nr:RES family NAD+ phosphorylase [Terriglobales bacterium]